jgi:hypothetical protein
MGFKVAGLDVELIDTVTLAACVEAKGWEGVIGDSMEALSGVGAAEVVAAGFGAVGWRIMM